ncbi:MAG TPA: GDSL-type esterase/lipase family protein [Chthoniobacteraceae bacterium]|nr:GDSL-type esterase/lipase family protein [Chthoniobacteraceae bacterium]
MSRKLLGIGLLVIACTVVTAAPPATPAPTPYIPPYEAFPPPLDKDWFSNHNHLVGLVNQASSKPQLDIYFLGDSITEFWTAKGLGEPVWDAEYSGKYRVLNNGVRGDTTQNILWRITHGEFDKIHPKVIVLLAGINNLGLDPSLKPADLAKGIQAIIAYLHAKSPESKIILVSILPSGEHSTDAVRKRIQDTNAIIAKFADGKTVYFLDIYNSFLDAHGTFIPALTPDYTHLTTEGYKVWADAMRELLQKLLGEPTGN